MKKIFLMFAFAGIATFASAQTEQVASKTSTKAGSKECTKVCTPEQKASCEKMVGAPACCAKASANSTAAKTEKTTTVSKKAIAATGNK